MKQKRSQTEMQTQQGLEQTNRYLFGINNLPVRVWLGRNRQTFFIKPPPHIIVACVLAWEVCAFGQSVSLQLRKILKELIVEDYLMTDGGIFLIHYLDFLLAFYFYCFKCKQHGYRFYISFVLLSFYLGYKLHEYNNHVTMSIRLNIVGFLHIDTQCIILNNKSTYITTFL